jgi:glycosyltransferase involved in cell wall biosynthesis
MSAAPIRVIALSRHQKESERGLCWDLRVHALIEPLAERGIVVDAHPLPAAALAKRRLLRHLAGRFDLCWLHRHVAWPWDLAAIRRTARQLVFDFADPVHLSPGGGLGLARRLKFAATCRASDLVLPACRELVRAARAWSNRVEELPAAIDPATIRVGVGVRRPTEPLRLIWVGSRSTATYLEAIKPVLESLPDSMGPVELTIVGAGRSLGFQRLTTREVNWSEAAQAAQLARAHIGLCPQPDTPWACGKATLKPRLYAAAGLPTVASAVGYPRQLLEEGLGGALVSSDGDWLTAIRRFEDEGARQSAGLQSLQFIHRFTRDRVADRLAELFRQRHEEPRRRRPSPALTLAREVG